MTESRCYNTGETEPKDQANYVMNGRILSGWVVRKRHGTRNMSQLRKIDPSIVKIPLTRKYRYVFLQAPRRTKARVLRVLQPFILPYPSRLSENIEPMNIAKLVSLRKDSRISHECGMKDSTAILRLRLSGRKSRGKRAALVPFSDQPLRYSPKAET